MEWETVLGLGEWAGSIAVFITLFYLSKQIRQQNRIAEYNVWNSMSGEHKRTCEYFLHDPEIYEIWRRGLNEPATLNAEESTRFRWIMQLLYNDLLKAWQAHRKGLLPEEDWEVQASVFVNDLNTPGGKDWRAANATVYPGLFEDVDKYAASEIALGYQSR